MDLKGFVLSEKKPVLKDYILPASIYITFFKCQNHRDGEKSSGCPGTRMQILREGGLKHKGVP